MWARPKRENPGSLVRDIIGGRQVTEPLPAETGGPITAEAQSGTAIGRDRGVAGDNTLDGGRECGSSSNSVDFLNLAEGTFGWPGMGVPRDPHLVTYDGGLFRDIAFRERLHLQFRAELFNLCNRAKFHNPGATPSTSPEIAANSATQRAIRSNPGSGSIKAMFDPRIGQPALKLEF